MIRICLRFYMASAGIGLCSENRLYDPDVMREQGNQKPGHCLCIRVYISVWYMHVFKYKYV
jgi:hypothetical protein